MIVGKDAFKDSSGNSLPKSDTIRFLTKSTNEYGRVVLRFSNLNLAQHPVLQFVEANAVKYSFPVTGNEWTNKMFPPGEYELRILYDNNNNGQWDPGHYPDKRQPEKAITLPQKLSIRADWDNERDINL